MARIKISVYVTPEVADTLKRLATVEDRSQSELIDDAIARRFAGTGHDAEHAAVIARLDALTRRLAVVEKAQERQFEFLAQGARFFLSVAPDIPVGERDTINARGAERLRNLLSLVATRLGAGRSAWRETVFDRETGQQASSTRLEPAE
jgi:hypothetical protein